MHPTMKALLLTEAKQLQLAEVPEPEVATDTVLIRVAACGICGSDVHGYDGSTGRRIPPIIMGHEAAGIVERVGSRATRFKPGDRVTFDSTVYCGECDFCQAGRVNLCDHRQVLGVSCGDYRRHGAFAELVAVPERIVFGLPDTLPMEHAAMIEALSVAVHAVDRSQADPGAFTAVVGAGMIGLLTVQALRAAGVGHIVAVDIDDKRLEFAKQLGADEVINSATQDAVASIRERTAGRGADATFEVVGNTDALNTAIESVAKGGSVTLVGNVSPRVDVSLQSIVTRELTLYGSCASQGDYPRCIELMVSGAVDVAPLISAKASLEEGPAWFERLYDREPGLMKVVLQP